MSSSFVFCFEPHWLLVLRLKAQPLRILSLSWKSQDELQDLLQAGSTLVSAHRHSLSAEVEELLNDVNLFLTSGQGDPSKWPIDLSSIRAPFFRKVYQELRRLPRGESISYKALAERCGSPKGMRAVGQAMAKNPWPLAVPCHRVMLSQGLGNYSAPLGKQLKLKLLEAEGVKFHDLVS